MFFAKMLYKKKTPKHKKNAVYSKSITFAYEIFQQIVYFLPFQEKTPQMYLNRAETRRKAKPSNH